MSEQVFEKVLDLIEVDDGRGNEMRCMIPTAGRMQRSAARLHGRGARSHVCRQVGIGGSHLIECRRKGDTFKSEGGMEQVREGDGKMKSLSDTSEYGNLR
eukprot:675204-Hanusia_phi.AAC.21